MKLSRLTGGSLVSFLLALPLTVFGQGDASEDWQTWRSSGMGFEVSFPSPGKAISIGADLSSRRIQNYSFEDLKGGQVPQLRENQYFIDLKIRREGEGGLLDLSDEAADPECAVEPVPLTGFDQGYLCSRPILQGEGSITHFVKIRQGRRVFFVALDGSRISSGVIDRILASIEVFPPSP